jgi:hypothetical protein
MRRVGRWAVLLVATAAPAGCGWGARPYAHDPLLRDGAGVWGDRFRAHAAGPPPVREPEPPRPPAPTNLPTLEWEAGAGG